MAMTENFPRSFSTKWHHKDRIPGFFYRLEFFSTRNGYFNGRANALNTLAPSPVHFCNASSVTHGCVEGGSSFSLSLSYPSRPPHSLPRPPPIGHFQPDRTSTNLPRWAHLGKSLTEQPGRNRAICWSKGYKEEEVERLKVLKFAGYDTFTIYPPHHLCIQKTPLDFCVW